MSELPPLSATNIGDDNFFRIVQTSPDGILIIDPAGYVQFANTAAQILFRRAFTELIGSEFGYPLLANESSEIDILQTGAEMTTVEMRVVEIQWQHSHAHLATFRDITQRKKSEAALRASEARFRGVLQWAIEGIILVDSRGRIMLANQQVEKLFGYSAESLVGMRVELLVPEFLREKHYAERNQFIQQPITRQMGRGLALSARKADGTTIPVDISLSVVPLENDFLIMAIVRDLSEQLRMEMQAREINLEREKVNFLQNFMGDLSHDFRTPLTILSSELYLLDRIDNPNERQTRVRKMQSQILRLSRMLDSMLHLSQLDTQAKPMLTAVDVRDVLTDLTQNLQRALSQARLNLSVEIDDSLQTIQVDTDHFYRMLQNLLENAIHYTPPEGAISLSAKRDANSVLILVADTGQGISAHDLPHIFKRFYRADKARQNSAGGSGLGLAIVKRVVEMHNGQISVESRLGKGTTFSVRLPL